MFELIGLALGAFIGFVVADFLGALDPLRDAIRQGLNTAREKLMQLAGSFNGNPLITIGVLLVLVVLVFWLLSFSSAMLLGVVAGIVYKEEIGRLPMISGIADTVKQKLSNMLSGPK